MRRFIILCGACLLNAVVAIADDNGYYYRSWATQVTVSANNTWMVSEDYEVNFVEQRHGIYRYINNEFGANRNVNADDEEPNIQYLIYRPSIDVISTNGATAEVTSSDENDNTVIRWGDPNRYVTGDHGYSACYYYQAPDDRISARDYIYHSLIPAGVPTRIEHFTFDITFEKPLPDDIANRLRIYGGVFGGEQLALVNNLVVTPTKISGEILDVRPYEAITIYAELPEGYYENTKKTNPLIPNVLCYIALALALLLIYRELTDSEPEISKSVEFYPPEEMTPTLVGKFIDGSTDTIDIAALIPWLAQKGYIQINEIPAEGGLFGKKADIELIKRQDLPEDAPLYQQKVMHLLFCEGDTLLMSKIGDRHFEFNAAKNAVDLIFRGDMTLTTTHHSMLMILLILVSTACMMTMSPIANNYVTQMITGAVWGGSFLAAWIYIFNAGDRQLFKSPLAKVMTFIGRTLLCVIINGLLYFTNADFEGFLVSDVLLLILVVACYMACELSVRNTHNTPYRAQMAGRLLGFREFIDTAEKDRLKMLVNDNPEYFYTVLPYAMIFGLTDKWTKLFKDIDIQPAEWYNTVNGFSSLHFTSSINNLSSSISNGIATTSVDHTASSSSGGGGGFSGGGGGGGGAGSW